LEIFNFLDRILLRCDGPDGLPHVRDWIAENQSCHPPPSEVVTWLPHYRGTREATIAIFLSTFISLFRTDELRSRISESCYFHRYEGSWNEVQELLEQRPTISAVVTVLLQQMSEDDFFGNFLKECEKFLRRERKGYKSLDFDRRRPRRKIRRRGYQDKGSLRPNTLRGSFPPDPTPGEDRRRKIIDISKFSLSDQSEHTKFSEWVAGRISHPGTSPVLRKEDFQ
jgi:hypothetical protein